MHDTRPTRGPRGYEIVWRDVKIPSAPHRWSVTPKRAVQIQRDLARGIRSTPLTARPRLVAGCDLAFTVDGMACIAGVVLWDRRAGTVVEERLALRPVRFPYVPGLLSFREAPALLAALRGLRGEPDALLCDGHGLAHPRRFGLACHLGLILDRPTVGCAKSRLIGEHAEPGAGRGSSRPLHDGGEVVGRVVRTRDRVRPVYVSVGHRIDLGSAVKLVLDCGRGLRLPEPVRLADRLVARARRSGWRG